MSCRLGKELRAALKKYRRQQSGRPDPHGEEHLPPAVRRRTVAMSCRLGSSGRRLPRRADGTPAADGGREMLHVDESRRPHRLGAGTSRRRCHLECRHRLVVLIGHIASSNILSVHYALLTYLIDLSVLQFRTALCALVNSAVHRLGAGTSRRRCHLECRHRLVVLIGHIASSTARVSAIERVSVRRTVAMSCRLGSSGRRLPRRADGTPAADGTSRRRKKSFAPR
jgi:hypothetical protein